MGVKQRPGKKGPRRTLEAMEKDARAADLYRKGLTYRQISAELGWRSASAAFSAVRRAVADTLESPLAAAEARALMIERIQDRRRRLWQAATTRHFMVDQGKVVTGADGQPVIDEGPVLRALDLLRKEDDLEARLRDLYPPSKRVVEVVTEEIVDQNIRAIRDRLIAAGALPDELQDGRQRLAIPAAAVHPGTPGQDRVAAQAASGGAGA